MMMMMIMAASNKVVSCAGLSSQGEFIPTAVESHGPIIRDAAPFLSELCSWRLVEMTVDVRALLCYVPTDFRCGATI